jgi:hypothetical protein
MMRRFRLLFAVLPLGLAAQVFSQSPAILQKARAYYGAEADLEAIRSVEYVGQLTYAETTSEGPQKSLSAEVEIVVQRPYQQRIVARGADKVEVTGLDGYEAWQRVEDPSDPGSTQLVLLGKEQVKRLRANTCVS